MQLWIEGFAATGESATHRLLGDYPQARTYMEAVMIYMVENPASLVSIVDGKAAIWGCEIFDNEEAAARNFG